MPDPLERSAATVRHLATRVLGLALPTGDDGRRLTEALTVCKHLQPRHHEACICAHRTLVRYIRADLALLGTTDVEFLTISNGLFDVLCGSGFEFDGHTWRSEVAPAVVLGPRLVETS